MNFKLTFQLNEIDNYGRQDREPKEDLPHTNSTKITY